MDIVKCESSEFVVKADLPGINKKDLGLTLSGDNLFIKDERREEEDI